MEKIKIYVVGGATGYARWIKNHTIVDNPEEANIILFTGGEDVDPSIYNNKKLPRTYSNLDRDKEELEIFKQIKDNQLALGICRGSQFLCAVNGGILVQDCDNHAIGTTHSITDGDVEVEITSTHHQMQYPFYLSEDSYDLLFYSTRRRCSYYDGDGIKEPPVEPEVVYYHVEGNPKCLAIQGHPEMMRPESPIINILNNLIEKCLTDVLSKIS